MGMGGSHRAGVLRRGIGLAPTCCAHNLHNVVKAANCPNRILCSSELFCYIRTLSLDGVFLHCEVRFSACQFIKLNLEKGTTKVAKAKTTKKTTVTKSKKQAAGDEEVTVCRRRTERRQTAAPATAAAAPAAAPAVAPERRKKVPRRRQIDPTTCERDYSQDEIEFMHALDAYKRSSGRMFPTCSEILEVVRGLGYSKPRPEGVTEPETPLYDPSEVDEEEAELAEMF